MCVVIFILNAFDASAHSSDICPTQHFAASIGEGGIADYAVRRSSVAVNQA